MAGRKKPHLTTRALNDMRALATTRAGAQALDAMCVLTPVLRRGRVAFDDLDTLQIALLLAGATYSAMRSGREPAPLSRQALARATGLARETVRRRVARLMDHGYVVETPPGLFLSSRAFTALVAIVVRPAGDTPPAVKARTGRKRSPKTAAKPTSRPGRTRPKTRPGD